MSWIVVIKARIIQKAVFLKQPRPRPMPEILVQFKDFCVIIFIASYSLFSLRIFCFRSLSSSERWLKTCILRRLPTQVCSVYRRAGLDCDEVTNYRISKMHTLEAPVTQNTGALPLSSPAYIFKSHLWNREISSAHGWPKLGDPYSEQIILTLSFLALSQHCHISSHLGLSCEPGRSIGRMWYLYLG